MRTLKKLNKDTTVYAIFALGFAAWGVYDILVLLSSYGLKAKVLIMAAFLLSAGAAVMFSLAYFKTPFEEE